MITMEKVENKKMDRVSFKLTTENLKEQINELTDKVMHFVDEMDYVMKGDVFFNELKNIGMINNLSLNKKKKLRNLLIKANNRMSLSSINLFYHFLYKNVLLTDKRVRFYVSDKEKSIQDKRKKWVKYRNLAEQYLNEYKEEKGDFYKLKEKQLEEYKN